MRAKAIMDRGELVSDEIVIELIESRLPEAEASGGAIFDGFPRTVAQAQALDIMLKGRGKQIDKVVRLKVDEEALVARITKRFTGRRPARRQSGDRSGCAWRPTTDQTAPLFPYYQEQGKLVEIDGMASVDDGRGDDRRSRS